MPSEFKIAVFSGDGIGPEITAPTCRVLERLQALSGKFTLMFEEAPAGAGHYARTGESLPAASLATARAADAILLSAMGDPAIRYPDGTEISPQIELRKELDLYAGLRPVRIAPGYPTPLRLPDDRIVDFMLIRESTEGLFWSMGRGEVSRDEARETLVITRETSRKLFRQTFALARQRGLRDGRKGKVTCVDKANVFRAFAFFREIFEEEAAQNPDVAHDASYVDAMALRMVAAPWALDVLVTENMFGDILSDLGAGLMGGLGLAPSADIGDGYGVFQPCHGSAPDIAGQGIANPIAMILSGGMMLDWLATRHPEAGLGEAAGRLRDATDRVIADGTHLTPDLGGDCDTEAVADAVIAALEGRTS
ncbi:MAG: isocitrate/isopropylmalate family dehydrogenase [Alphaproteobacteria bacterium]|nr:isocitrate/isopropylmalate family dehydrogenase [Alphaproteobacteria bacterium]